MTLTAIRPVSQLEKDAQEGLELNSSQIELKSVQSTVSYVIGEQSTVSYVIQNTVKYLVSIDS